MALSVKSDMFAASRSLSSRAAETLVLFMTSVLIAVLLVASQPATALGWELLALAVASGTILFILDRRAGHATPRAWPALSKGSPPTRSPRCSLPLPGSPFLVKVTS